MTAPQTLIRLSGGAPRVPSWQEAALVVIDHQAEYTSGKLPLAGVEAAVGQIADLLRQARGWRPGDPRDPSR
ncbi:MAG: hypothetical protein GAK35_04059 [Herbaspirillum frisingense]|uniref:Isochorismatase family protein n=1 Tax=Herbaspirillum frisingense TaxID=92645 RepID=A0A7V8FT36_9BURK|nr:MAG: hypothetical protein GAK35_04059 [Herbaspirillum frisingense]